MIELVAVFKEGNAQYKKPLATLGFFVAIVGLILGGLHQRKENVEHLQEVGKLNGKVDSLRLSLNEITSLDLNPRLVNNFEEVYSPFLKKDSVNYTVTIHYINPTEAIVEDLSATYGLMVQHEKDSFFSIPYILK